MRFGDLIPVIHRDDRIDLWVDGNFINYKYHDDYLDAIVIGISAYDNNNDYTVFCVKATKK